MLVVLGMHRSGTSLCAHMLHALGADMADDPGRSPANARGHWERPQINDLNEAVFALFGRGWQDSAHALALPEHWLADPRVQLIRRRLTDHLSARLRHAAGAPWGFKDPRTARLMPLWRQVWSDLGVVPRFVLCLRSPRQVARSLRERDRLSSGQGAYRWCQYVAGAVRGLAEDPVCVVPYEAWFTAGEDLARQIAAHAGLPAPAQGLVQSIVAAGLRHDDAASTPAPDIADRLYAALAVPGSGPLSADARDECDRFLAFEQLAQPMLVESEILRASVQQQNKVIADLQSALRDLRGRSAA